VIVAPDSREQMRARYPDHEGYVERQVPEPHSTKHIQDTVQWGLAGHSDPVDRE
jgi:hypothetical protein